MASVKAWKDGEAGAPAFPAEFEILKKAVLQVTDIKTNRNKYYAVELHAASAGGTTTYRVFTHYGRTDDLETNPEAGQKECRYFTNAAEADANYQSIDALAEWMATLRVEEHERLLRRDTAEEEL